MMKTFKQIINEELLNEAIKINNANDIIELIKDKKLGVKMEPSWKEINTYDDDTIKDLVDNFGDILQALKEQGLTNNITWIIQLLISKAKVDDMLNGIPKDYIIEIAKGKNKPWAKETEEWKDMLSKPYSSELWHKVEKKLQEEGQKHGKHNKGAGKIEDVKELYNDGTWTLNVPSTWEGAKAVSYFGKGEEKNPTHWCTRASKGYYDTYTREAPLYIIRNLKTGKAYQMAFLRNAVEFLDQDDVKGDDITKGDLSTIPDELLTKIKYNGRSLKDYKHNFKDEVVVKNRKQIKNPSLDIDKAEWSKPIHVKDDVYKKIWTNYTFRIKDEPLKQYIINGKNNYEGPKHNGFYAAKYYYKDHPSYSVVCTRDNHSTDSNYYRGNFVINGEVNNYFDTDKKKSLKNLEKYAFDDFGQTKSYDKWKKQSKEYDEQSKESTKYYTRCEELYSKLMIPEINKVLKKYIRDIKLGKIHYGASNYRSGAFLPVNFELIYTNNKGNVLFSLPYENNNGKIDYTPNKDNIYKEHNMFKASLLSVFEGDKAKVEKIIKELNDAITRVTKEYSKIAVKDRTGRNLRMIGKNDNEWKSKGYREKNPNAITLQFENYFNY